MGIFVHGGRAGMAKLILSCPIHLAIGDGGENWNEGPSTPDYDETRLRREIGRKALFRGIYVVPDNEGVLEMPNGKRYAMSETPTRHLYLQFVFNYGEGVDAPVREMGVFLNSRSKSDLPGNQTFFVPDDLEDEGTLLFLAHLAEEERFNPEKRGMFEIVLSF